MLNPNPALISQIKLVLGLNPNDDLIAPLVDDGETPTSAQTDHVRLRNLHNNYPQPPPLPLSAELYEILMKKKIIAMAEFDTSSKITVRKNVCASVFIYSSFESSAST